MNHWIMLLILKSVSGYAAAASTIYTHGMAECPRFWSPLLFTKYVGCEKTRLQVTSEYKIGTSAIFHGTICTLDNTVE